MPSPRAGSRTSGVGRQVLTWKVARFRAPGQSSLGIQDSPRKAITGGGARSMRATLDQVIHVDVRPIAADEVATVQKTLPPGHPEAHVRRLADQRSGQITYLVAWHEGRALGHVLVRWGGTTDPELLWKLGRPV